VAKAVDDIPDGQFGPAYNVDSAALRKFRGLARGGLETLATQERRAYGAAVEAAILSAQRAALRRQTHPEKVCSCASGTNHNDGAAIEKAIRAQHRASLQELVAAERSNRTPEEWKEMYEQAMKEKRERQAQAAAMPVIVEPVLVVPTPAAPIAAVPPAARPKKARNKPVAVAPVVAAPIPAAPIVTAPPAAPMPAAPKKAKQKPVAVPSNVVELPAKPAAPKKPAAKRRNGGESGMLYDVLDRLMSGFELGAIVYALAEICEDDATAFDDSTVAKALTADAKTLLAAAGKIKSDDAIAA